MEIHVNDWFVVGENLVAVELFGDWQGAEISVY
jgi:hypothetical protein